MSRPITNFVGSFKTNQYRVVELLLGSFFVAIAGLKIFGWSVEPYSRVGAFNSVQLQLVLIIFELSIGLLLIAGKSQLIGWITTLSTFAIFSGYSLYAVLIGQSSCGCFGAVKVNPMWTLGFDLFMVCLLLVRRPEINMKNINSQSLFNKLKIVLIGVSFVILFLSIALAIAYVGFGSPAAAIAFLRGETITLSPKVLEVGEGDRGEFKSEEIMLTNWGDKIVRIVGGSADCSISANAKLPLIVHPKQTISIPIVIRFPKNGGYFTRNGMLVLDDDGLQQVYFQFSGVSK